MSRPLRMDQAGGWYHVIARGNERKDIYRDDRDRAHFLELLEETTARFGLLIHAYVLMPNHYHLLLQTPRRGLSRAMQWLNVSYSLWFNARHRRSGHLFQGRFKSILVEGDGSWVLQLSAYIHLNPVRVGRLGLSKAERAIVGAGRGAAPRAEQIREWLCALRGFRWSSYRAYGGYQEGPAWLEQNTLLRRLGKQETRRAYRRYVEDQVRLGVIETPWERMTHQAFLGSSAFVDKMRKGLKRIHREHPDRRRLEAALSFEDAVECVEGVKGEKWEQFKDRRGDWGRDAVLWLARRRGAMKLGELAERLGGLDYTTVSQAVRRLEHKAAQDRNLRQVLSKLERTLSNVKM